MSVTVKFAWYDLWIGVFYDRQERALYICPVPTLVVKVRRGEQADEARRRHAQAWAATVSLEAEVGRLRMQAISDDDCDHSGDPRLNNGVDTRTRET